MTIEHGWADCQADQHIRDKINSHQISESYVQEKDYDSAHASGDAAPATITGVG